MWPPRAPEGALVRLAVELFHSFGEVAPRFSQEQVNQGLWYLNRYPFFLPDHLTEVEVELAKECIRAGYHVFRDYVAP